MAEAAVQAKPSRPTERQLTDGFHLVIDALKLNGLKMIYWCVGIPITDFGRMAQAAGIRAIVPARSSTQATPPRSPVSRRKSPASASQYRRPASSTANGAAPCHDQLLPDDFDFGLVRARDRGFAAGRRPGDGRACHRQAALQGRVSRAARSRYRHRHSARSAPRCPVALAVSISICRPSCSVR